MAQTRICCCGATVWTSVIAVIKLIWCIVLAVLIAVGELELNGGSHADHQKITTGLLLALTSLSFVMLRPLLLGNAKKHAGYLKVWLVYEVIALVLYVILIILKCCYATDNEKRTFYIFVLLIGIPIYLFFLWVVRTHKNEIEANERRS